MVRLLVLSVLDCVPAPSELASVTVQCSVRVVAVALTVGSSLVELKVIEASAVWYCAFFYTPVFLEKFLKVPAATVFSSSPT